MAKGYINISEGSDKKVASHSFTEDSETKHVERVAPGAGVLVVPGTAQVSEETSTGTYPATAIDVTGKAGIVVKSTFSNDSATCKVKFLFLDSAGSPIGVSGEYTLSNSGVADGSRYIGSAFMIDNQQLAASGVKIVITTAPASGNVSFFIAGV